MVSGRQLRLAATLKLSAFALPLYEKSKDKAAWLRNMGIVDRSHLLKICKGDVVPRWITLSRWATTLGKTKEWLTARTDAIPALSLNKLHEQYVDAPEDAKRGYAEYIAFVVYSILREFCDCNIHITLDELYIDIPLEGCMYYKLVLQQRPDGVLYELNLSLGEGHIRKQISGWCVLDSVRRVLPTIRQHYRATGKLSREEQRTRQRAAQLTRSIQWQASPTLRRKKLHQL